MDAPLFVVSGAAGFVGRAVAEELSAYGEVIGLARKPAVDAPSSCKMLVADLAKGLPLELDCRDATVIHAAGTSESALRDELWSDNVEGTRQMLEWAVRRHARHFIYISTGKVYGYNLSRSEAHVETDSARPLGFYGHSKRIGEQLVEAFHAAEGLPATIIRLFFTHGPGQRHGLLHRIEQSIRNGLPLAINNDGAPRLNPIHIDDVATAIVSLLEPREGAQIYNICGDEVVSFLGLVQAAEARLGMRANCQKTGLVCGDLLGSNARLKRNFDWSPRKRLLPAPAPIIRRGPRFEPMLDAILACGHP